VLQAAQGNRVAWRTHSRVPDLRSLRSLVRDTRSISSLDHVIGTQQDRLRDGEAERLRGLEVDDEAEPRRLLERQIGGLLAPQDAPDEICAALVEKRFKAADKDNDGTLDKKELNSSAGKALLRLLQ